MSSGSPKPGPAEVVKTEDATMDPSEEQPASASETVPEDSQESQSTIGSDASSTTGTATIREGISDAALLSEVRSSLQTIGSGVEELANTVNDLLGLSDSDSSDDYIYEPGSRKTFSWSKMKTHAASRRRKRKGLKNPQDDRSTSASGESESDDGGPKKPREIIPEIKKCNLEQFQSRQAGDSHKLYCVDVLVAGDSLDDEIYVFKETTDKIASGIIESWKPARVSDRGEDSISGDSGKKWIRRIRINSRAVMRTLRHLCPEMRGYRGRPTIFCRPFQLLVSLHNEIKEQLINLKELAPNGFKDETNLPNTKVTMDLSIAGARDSNNLMEKLGDKHDALDQLTCFVDFMESEIIPDSRRYRDTSSSMPKMIRYEDLWYLFKPGDLVYVNPDLPGQDVPSSQRILRLMQTILTLNSSKALIGMANFPPHNQRFSGLGHFIEHDGSSYAPSHYRLPWIPSFRGEKKVTDLPIYPVSYLEDDRIMEQAISDGETYVNLVETRSGFYSGWTQTVNPFGNRLKDESSENRFASPEHIESDILVDFQETFNAIPDWKPVTYGFTADMAKTMPATWLWLLQCDLPVLQWDGVGPTKLDFSDQTIDVDATERVEAKRFLMEDELGQFSVKTRTVPTGKFLALLPRRFFAYAVLERKFVQLSTQFVRNADLEANDKAFEKLEINRNYKRLILALVKSHFDKIETEKKKKVEIETQDLIRGKGKGVVILLHGVPGVGKTATAEAVALKWKKPLFPITCGDLGYTAETLEKSLNEIFRLAHHWGCILLLDEADVFITQRERKDLKRNALVSAFLRVLEYYNGIMFLTTNRAGVLDEAIKSRVHLNLHYDHLTEEQTVAIFRQHIQRLRDIEKQRNPDPNEQIMVLHKEIIQFARDHYNQRDPNHGSGSNFGRWNGRQIRNAFLIASSLAHYDSEDEGDDKEKDELDEPGRKKQKQLGRSQFKIVAETTLMYDKYRASVHSGKSDEHVAAEREERAMSSQPRSPTPARLQNSSSFS